MLMRPVYEVTRSLITPRAISDLLDALSLPTAAPLADSSIELLLSSTSRTFGLPTATVKSGMSGIATELCAGELPRVAKSAIANAATRPFQAPDCVLDVPIMSFSTSRRGVVGLQD